MTAAQITVLLILGAVVGLFLWGKWRHDLVAVMALVACVVSGLVAPDQAFSGFGHPAVITVACMLIMSKALQASGAVEVMARYALPNHAGPVLSLAALMGLGAALSGFMNNVGAMALLMPMAIKVSKRLEMPPGRVLMPLAFGTILGGMTTLIGTPPNLIVAGFRAGTVNAQGQVNGSFGMFDFTAIGLPVAVAGILFVAFIGWRLVPKRQPAGMEGFDTGAYLTEVRILEGGASADKRVAEVEKVLDAAGGQIVGMVRSGLRLTAPNPRRILHAGDILVIEAAADTLPSVLSNLGLKLEAAGVHPQAGSEDPTVASSSTKMTVKKHPGTATKYRWWKW
jgi:di/tricarboxylate transporter